jgi:hypothetical protein
MGRLKRERKVLDILFPRVRAEMLRALFGPSIQRRHVRELMRKSGLALSTVQDELRKSSAVGAVTSASNGYHRFYRANQQHPLFSVLARIVHLSETLPSINGSRLRQGRNRRRRARRKRRPARLSSERLYEWGIFSKAPKQLDRLKRSSLR